MNFINPPEKSPKNVYHKTFYSQILNHKLGYNIYLPPEYNAFKNKYPVVYHIHGWNGNESSEIWSLEKVYQNKDVIFVFINAISTKEDYFEALFQIETVIINEIIPHIESTYKIDAARNNRMLSGFSMGGNMAFYYAVKNYDLFGSITAYAGTYHHLYNKEYRTVGVKPEKVQEMYEGMINEQWYLEDNNILSLVRQNADKIRGKLKIFMHIGKRDILFCDNEILHLYLKSLDIPHEYIKYDGVDHNLEKIV